MTPLTSYVDEYGRPKVGPGGAPQGTIAAGTITTPPNIIEYIRKGIEAGVTPQMTFPSADNGQTLDLLKNLFNSLLNLFKSAPGVGFGAGIAGGAITMPKTTVPQTEIPSISTNLNLNLQTQTQLIVDGRMLADVIKPYLFTDMVQYEGAAGSATSTYTFA
jgi:hypothetical protein